MRVDSFRLLLWLIVFIAGVYFTIRYLWPLVLVVIVLIAIGMFRMFRATREVRKEAEKAAETLRKEESMKENSWQSDLFYEQAARKKEEAGEIIDVEFTRKDEADGEEKNL